MSLFIESVNVQKINPAHSGTAEAFLRLAKEIRNGKCSIEGEGNEEYSMTDARDVFASVYDIAGKGGFEFAYRTVREIRQYISASFELFEGDAEFDIYQAIDEQLLQKILPKIHGNRKEIGNLLDELEVLCKDGEKELELSAKKIEQMKGKLANVQYASFI